MTLAPITIIVHNYTKNNKNLRHITSNEFKIPLAYNKQESKYNHSYKANMNFHKTFAKQTKNQQERCDFKSKNLDRDTFHKGFISSCKNPIIGISHWN
jgi:hypothetical protein